MKLGYKSALLVPLLQERKAIGCIAILRATAGQFDDQEVSLAQTFADQAVIAIQNARLFNETKEALEQQTATAEVLQVISSSVADTAPVFEKILDSCQHLFASTQVGILLAAEGQVHVGAWRGSASEAMGRAFPGRWRIRSPRRRYASAARYTLRMSQRCRTRLPPCAW